MRHPLYEHEETDEIAGGTKADLSKIRTFDDALAVANRIMGENGSSTINSNLAEALLERADAAKDT